MGDGAQVFQTISPVFKSKFLRLKSIIDCFEIFIESQRNLLARAQCYTQYKKYATIKVFISCKSLGAVNFVSKFWGRWASDIQIVRKSGFTTTRFHMPGDHILADREFTFQEDFSRSELTIPAFARGKKSFQPVKLSQPEKLPLLECILKG